VLYIYDFCGIKKTLQFATISTSTLQKGHDLESNTLTQPSLRVLYETLFYRHLGAAQTDQGWPYYQFLEALFSLDLGSLDLKDLHLELISMLKKAVTPEFAVFPLPVEPNGKETIGFCSNLAKVGDVIAIVMGCRFPLVLRPREWKV